MTADWSIEDKTSLVTGANTGLGRATAIELARRGSRVILAARSKERTTPVLEQISSEVGADRVEFLSLDLASLASVKQAAGLLLAGDRPLHVVINNAGLAGQNGLTADGFQLTFGVNHLGHYLFTRLLLDRLRESSPARVVHVSSDMHHGATGIDWNRLRKPSRLPGIGEYRVSKLANVLFNVALADRWDGIGVTTYAVHPGAVATDIYRRVPRPFRGLMMAKLLSPAEGARTQVRCAADPALADQTGLYYAREKPADPNPLAGDPNLVEDLWDRSEAWVADYL
jgi:NAD(P)-dependent dehydrogenase (short-subunit alcohol dehydrogenase family)